MDAASPPPRGPRTELAGTRIADTAAALTRRQTALAGDWARSQGDDRGEIVAVGQESFHSWLFTRSRAWRDLRSVRNMASQSTPDLVLSLRNNRKVVDDGLRMVSVFVDLGPHSGLVDLLASQAIPYRMAAAAMDIKLIDGTEVLLEGPRVDGERTIMVARDDHTLALAQAHWHAVIRSSRAASDLDAIPAMIPGSTPRQRAVAALLAHDASDEHAAQVLEISVRTLRTEVAAIKRALGVTTRFAAGLELGRRMSAAPPT